MLKIVLRAIIVLIISAAVFVAVFFAADKTDYSYTSTYVEEPKVYVTDYGRCYHHISCHNLRRSSNPKGKFEAEGHGYRACSYCNGRAKGTIVVEYREYYSIVNYTKAVIPAIIHALVANVGTAAFFLIKDNWGD